MPVLEYRNPSVLFSSSVSEVHRDQEMNKRKKFKVSESDESGGERKFLKYSMVEGVCCTHKCSLLNAVGFPLKVSVWGGV